MQVLANWDFAGADIHRMTHGLHPYPARMIPQIAEQLIAIYGKSASNLLDPFCGSGGVLVESLLAGKDCIGLDLNPLACLIAKVKTTAISPRTLTREWEAFRARMNNFALKKNFESSTVEIPDFQDLNIEYWFKEDTIKDLSIIRQVIDGIEDQRIRDFMKVCFSHTVRTVSGTRKGEFKLYRMEESQWTKWSPDVFKTFNEKVNSAISKMGSFYETIKAAKRESTARVFQADTRNILTDLFPKEAARELKERSVDLIVTSPPYGDSHTTVAYGQFSKYSLIWLGFSKMEALEVDKASLGGRHNGFSVKSSTLDKTLASIGNEARAREVKDFFTDLGRCMEKLSVVMKSRAIACLVLGNRTVKGVPVQTDQILVDIGREVGLEKADDIIHRNIPSKRIPWKSSPTNVVGKKVNTIGKESIVILRKED